MPEVTFNLSPSDIKLLRYAGASAETRSRVANDKGDRASTLVYQIVEACKYSPAMLRSERELDEDAADGVSVAQVLGRDINALAERLAKVEDRLAGQNGVNTRLNHAVDELKAQMKTVDEFDDRMLSLTQRINTVEPMLKRAAELVELAPKIQKQVERAHQKIIEVSQTSAKFDDTLSGMIAKLDTRLSKLIAPERPAPGSGDAQEADVLHDSDELPAQIGDSVYLPNCNSAGGAQLDAGWYVCCGKDPMPETKPAVIQVKRERDGALFYVQADLVTDVKRKSAEMPAGGVGTWVKTSEETPSDV